MEESIWAYIDNEMSPEERKAFEKELKLNKELAAQYAEMNKIHMGLSSMVVRNAPAGLIDKTMSAIEPSPTAELNKWPIYIFGGFLFAAFALILIGSTEQGSLLTTTVDLSSYAAWFEFAEDIDLSFFMNSFMVAIFAIPIVIAVDIWLSRNTIEYQSLRLL